MPKIIAQLNAAGLEDRDIIIISATGTHRMQTADEHRILIGDELANRFEILDHDCRDNENHVYVGTTSFGTRVMIDRRAMECKHIIITGGIVYHFLPGWSGGKKSILPGISSYETVMHNHGLSLVPEFGKGVRPTVHSGNIDNNPVYQDMLEAANFVKPDFMFNVIVGHEGQIAGAVAGNYVTAHERGCRMVDQLNGVKIKGKADLVVATAGGYPKDINFYQSIKVLLNAERAVKDGGTAILMFDCPEGIGGDGGLEDILTNFSTMNDREKCLRDAFSISKFVGYYFCSVETRVHVIMVTNLNPDTFKTTGIILKKTLKEAVEEAKTFLPDDYTANIMPLGANTFPITE